MPALADAVPVEPALEHDLVAAWDDLPDAVYERRTALREILRHGIPLSAAAKALGVSAVTIKRDLRWIRETAARWLAVYVPLCEIGDAAFFFDEVERLSLRYADAATRPHDVFVIARSEYHHGGRRIRRTQSRTLVDHAATARHLQTAIRARVQRLVAMERAGLLAAIPTTSESELRQRLGRLSDEQLRDLAAANQAKIKELHERIASLGGLCP